MTKRQSKHHVRLAVLILIAALVASAALTMRARPAEAQYADQRQWAPATAMGGTPNAQTINLPNYNLNVGAVVRFLPVQANTGAMTLSINGGLPKAVVRPTATGILPTGGGELVPGQMAQVVYDGTQYQLTANPIAGTGTVTSVTCGSGLLGGTITTTGTCSLATTGIAAVAQGGTGQSTFALNLPLLGNGTSPLNQGTLSGNTTTFATTAGTLNSTHCVEIDVSGNLVDAGGPCTTGGGGGTVTPGAANAIAYYASAGTTLSGVLPTNNAMLVTGPTGVPTLATSLPAGLAVPWSSITSTPTTLAGYGVSAVPWTAVTGTPMTLSGYGVTAVPWSVVTGTPTTLAGYGVAAVPWTTLTGKPTTLSGYGINSPLDGAQGGTGVNNSGKIITLSGNLAVTGATAMTLAGPAASVSYTMPTASSSLLSNAGAVLSVTSLSPVTTTSTSLVMAGYGTSCKLTPVNSTRAFIMFYGQYNSNTASDGVQAQLRFGTGTPPANGVAAAGTPISAPPALQGSPSAGFATPFAVSAVLTGMGPGTTYWFDIAMQVLTGGQGQVANDGCVAFEM